MILNVKENNALHPQGKFIEPEDYDSVTILMCDIVSFTSLSSESTANQIVEMLNNLYNMFDDTIDNYHVYKVRFRWLKNY